MPGQRRLRGGAAMWGVAAELVAIFLLSNLPTPLYESYRKAFGFSPVMLTVIYAVYVVGTVVTMFFLGRLSDQIGRRPVVLVAYALGALSAGAFLLARGTGWLLVARILSGFAVALASGASTAWVLELHPREDTASATQVAIGANSLGLALGPLIAGFLAEYGPMPLKLPYLVFLPVLGLAALIAWRSEESVEDKKPARDAELRPRIGVPKEIRSRFVTPVIAAFVTFAVLGFYSALIPTVLTRALHNSNRAVAGGVVAAVFLVALVTIITAPRLKPRHGMVAGLVLLIPGVALMVIAQALHSMALLLLGTAVTGAASGLGYRFGLQRVNELAPHEQRSEVVSSYLIVCYAAISLPVIGVALLSGPVGPLLADAIFGGLIVLLALAALAYELRPSRRDQAQEA